MRKDNIIRNLIIYLLSNYQYISLKKPQVDLKLMY